MAVKFRLNIAEGRVRRDTQQPGTAVTFVNLLIFRRHDFDFPEFSFAAHCWSFHESQRSLTKVMNTVYRIYTEDADRDAVVSAVSERFESFTLHETTGYFKGQPEKSIVIEIIEARERTSSSSRVRFAPSTAKRLF